MDLSGTFVKQTLLYSSVFTQRVYFNSEASYEETYVCFCWFFFFTEEFQESGFS